MTKRKFAYWVIPPEADGEFVAAMEDVLEVFSRPYDALVPVLCMDEQPIQLLKETREPIAATARAVVSRLEFHYTPKHGSWLNIAENELSSMTSQCLKNRRFGMIEELRKETAAWHSAINRRQRGVDWQFRIDDARVKLRTVYPKIVV